MNIPKEAIEKAIEGGWEKPRFGWETEEHSELCSIALDPLFWQALGKSLGWDSKGTPVFQGAKKSTAAPEPTCKCCNKVREFCRCWHFEMYDEWRGYAHRLYDLILTNGDTDQFWAELLASN